jgi:superfamily I DNA/RNA helicase
MSLEFTDQQKKVIDHDHKKNGVVRAGPGTGKSMTVVALAQRLAKEGKADGVKFLTFTRAATSELAKKIASTEGLAIKPSTIHSFATSILMKNQDALPTKLPLRIPSDFEIAEIIYPYIAAKSNLRKTRVKKLVHHMASMWESLTEEDAPDFTPEERSRFNSAFQNATRLFGFTLLSQLPDLLRKMLTEQSEIKGIDLNLLIVDEYQD